MFFNLSDFRDLGYLNDYGVDKATKFLELKKQFIDRVKLEFKEFNSWRKINVALIKVPEFYKGNEFYKISRKSMSQSSYIVTNKIKVNNKGSIIK